MRDLTTAPRHLIVREIARCGRNWGLNDKISIYALKKNGGVWFANKLDATLKAVEVPIVSGTGDILVK